VSDTNTIQDPQWWGGQLKRNIMGMKNKWNEIYTEKRRIKGWEVSKASIFSKMEGIRKITKIFCKIA